MSKISVQARAEAAFNDYLAQGVGRSLDKLFKYYQELKKKNKVTTIPSLSTLEGWSKRFNWQERVLEETKRERELSQQKVAAERAKWAKVRLENAQFMQAAGISILSQAALDKLSIEEAREMLNQVVKLVSEGHKMERLELGESTENLNLTPPKPLEEMDDAELSQWEDYVRSSGRT